MSPFRGSVLNKTLGPETTGGIQDLERFEIEEMTFLPELSLPSTFKRIQTTFYGGRSMDRAPLEFTIPLASILTCVC